MLLHEMVALEITPSAWFASVFALFTSAMPRRKARRLVIVLWLISTLLKVPRLVPTRAPRITMAVLWFAAV